MGQLTVGILFFKSPRPPGWLGEIGVRHWPHRFPSCGLNQLWLLAPLFLSPPLTLSLSFSHWLFHYLALSFSFRATDARIVLFILFCFTSVLLQSSLSLSLPFSLWKSSSSSFIGCTRPKYCGNVLKTKLFSTLRETTWLHPPPNIPPIIGRDFPSRVESSAPTYCPPTFDSTRSRSKSNWSSIDFFNLSIPR